jgi:hypothetical protein
MSVGEHLRSVVDEQKLHRRLPCVHVSAPVLDWSRGPGEFAGSRRMRPATLPLSRPPGALRCDSVVALWFLRRPHMSCSVEPGPPLDR